MSDNLPDNGGYVAAAYLVFLVLLLVYFAISAVRLSRLEKDLTELNAAAAEQDAAGAAPASTSERTPA